MSDDLYAVIGVSKSATEAEIKKAYRKLAMQYHPDRNPDNKQAEEKFRDVTKAYEILSDPQKRSAYDRYGAQAFEQGGQAGGSSGFSGGGFGGFGAFSEIFEEMFGDRQTRTHSFEEEGADIRYNLDISLEEAFLGTTAHLKFQCAQKCDACKGSGSLAGASVSSCGRCGGRGKIRQQQGFFTIERTCDQCHGAGQVIKNPCTSCRGQGRLRKEKSLDVKIPAGIEEGTRIRVSNEGESGARGGASGDLYVFLSIRPHRLFKRQGNDILCRVPIPFTIAALGGDIDVPTIDGVKASVRIPAGTQSQQSFRLRSKGMTILKNKSRGDMLIEAFVEIPVNLSKKQKELLRQFDEEGKKESNHPESTGFFAKIKEFWDDIASPK